MKLSLAALAGAAVLALVGTAYLPAASAAEALKAPTEVKQVPDAADQLDLDKLPKSDSGAQALDGVTPQFVARNSCILFPGQTRSYTFTSALGNNFYRVIPNSFFDVVMTVRLAGFRAVRIDRFFAGGIERYNFFSPPPRRLVTVTISGFRGSTGCFRFEARP